MQDQVVRTTAANRAYLAFIVAVVLTFFVINLVQARQTGSGYGIGDTETVDTRQANDYRESVGPRP